MKAKVPDLPVPGLINSMPRLELSLLGSFQAKLDGELLTNFHSNKARALLAYLAQRANYAHQREVLVAFLWSELPEENGRNGLRTILTNFRRIFSLETHQNGNHPSPNSPPLMTITRHSVQLNAAGETCWIDVAEFDQLWRMCESHDHQNITNCPNCIQRLEQVVTLYQGDFLSGLSLKDSEPYDEWRRLQQENYHRQTLRALGILGSYYLGQKQFDRVPPICQQEISLEPWREGAHRKLMLALVKQGERTAALTQYEICRRILLEQAGLEPSAEIKELQKAIADGSLKAASLEQPVALSDGLDPKAERRSRLEARLEPLRQQRLFGVDDRLQKLRDLIHQDGPPWLICLEGLGGLGKTTLADRLAREEVEADRFDEILWVSAKQQTFYPADGIKPAPSDPAFDEESILTTMLGELTPGPYRIRPMHEVKAALRWAFRKQPCLVILDNLESVTNLSSILATLRSMTNPTKFIFTSRHSLRHQDDIYVMTLSELAYEDSIALINYEAQSRGLDTLARASEDQLSSIYDVVGGNPLALKLVIGQVFALPLPVVLRNLREAKGKRVYDFYTYIYWQSWRALSQNGKRALLTTAATYPRGSKFEHLVAVSELDEETFSQVLAELTALSVIEVRGDLEQPRYYIHRLTQTFLMTEIAKWLEVPQEIDPGFKELHGTNGTMNDE